MKAFNIVNIFFLLSVLRAEFSYASAADSKSRVDEKYNNYLKRVGNKYLVGVSKRENIIKMKSGMLIEILKTSEEADPISPEAYSDCEITYIGMFPDGKVFDQGTTEFKPRRVIKV